MATKEELSVTVGMLRSDTSRLQLVESEVVIFCKARSKTRIRTEDVICSL